MEDGEYGHITVTDDKEDPVWKAAEHRTPDLRFHFRELPG